MQYSYPQVSGGYRWVLLQRCFYEVGIEPTCVTDTNNQTIVEFSRELTTQEKTNLDTLMADNPTKPPSTGVRVQIRDLWEDRAEFLAATGLPNLRIFYGPSVEGGPINRIMLWHPTSLTNAQKNAVKTAYTNLFLG